MTPEGYDPEEVEQLACYECPECGPLVDEEGTPGYPSWQLSSILGGDELGFLRCPEPDCEEELELTLDARLDVLKMVAERIPELAPKIADAIEGVTDGG